MDLSISPLTETNWKDFEKLFGPKGACAGCWCMYWRIPKKDYESGKGAGNKKRMKQLIMKGKFAGLLAYSGKDAVGWCSLGPREEFPALDRSKILARIDDKPVWSIVCFFIDKAWRKKGLSTRFLEEIAKYAKKKGVKILEGYPIDTDQENYPSTFAWTGFFKSFQRAGFKEVARRSPTRPIMRLTLLPAKEPRTRDTKEGTFTCRSLGEGRPTLTPTPTPKPILLNCWKHHLGFLLERIREYNSENQLKKLKSNLLNIGNSTTDLYTGIISPSKAAQFAIKWIRKEGHFSQEEYTLWVRNSSGEYRCLKYPDDSVWVFRIGIEPERYVHIHPGRNVPQTLRVKANVLKSVIGTIVYSRIYKESPFSLSMINKARKNLLGLSPVKSIDPGSEFGKMLEMFSKEMDN